MQYNIIYYSHHAVHITSHLLEWRSSKRQEVTNVGEDVEKREPCAMLVGMQTGAAPVENSMEVPQKLKSRTTIPSNNSNSEYLSEENENTNLKRFRHTHVHCNVVYKSQDMETT